MRRVILVFVKEPVAGRVKTRLAADVGEAAAALAYRQMTCRVFEQVRLARPDAIAVAFDPADRVAEIQSFLHPWLAGYPGDVCWLPQAEGNLGSRLETAFDELFEATPDAGVAAIGTDCVNLGKDLFDQAWGSLADGTEAVFGPSEDGGYYLVGLARPCPELFRNIPWSTPDTLASSLGEARAAGLAVALLDERMDVDTVGEWRRIEPEVTRRRCVFFDRDGVVNRSPGEGYVLSADDFHLNPGIPEVLAWLKERDWLAILVTSQKGVGKGLISREELDRIHRKMQVELESRGAAFDGIYAYTGERDCAHRPKPDPEMILSAAESFFIDLRQSLMIGDADRDIDMARAAGVGTTIRIHGEKQVGIPADHTLHDVGDILDLFKETLKL